MKPTSLFIGFDPREAEAFAVARSSLYRHSTSAIRGLVLNHLRRDGLYKRPTERRINSEGVSQLWDVISDHWMSTEFAISRFLVPYLSGYGLALFVDSDVLIRGDVVKLFDEIQSGVYGRDKAVWCVKHDHLPAGGVKMDGQIQSAYSRKNWSSVMVFDCDHPANKCLTPEMVNTLPGRDLHRFCWLDDDEIGALPSEWNHLIGEQPPRPNAKIAHFTLGIPSMAGRENCEYAAEWRAELERWAA
jgi:hypothetical protein